MTKKKIKTLKKNYIVFIFVVQLIPFMMFINL